MRRDAILLAARVDALAAEQKAVRQALEAHEKRHWDDRRMATAARRWYVSTAVAAAGAVAYVISTVH